MDHLQNMKKLDDFELITAQASISNDEFNDLEITHTPNSCIHHPCWWTIVTWGILKQWMELR